jgi:hypothetical protein
MKCGSDGQITLNKRRRQMGKTSYLRFNPETREIELEGSEEFIKSYFDKLQQKLPQSSGEGKKEPQAATALPAKKTKVKAKAKAKAKAKVIIPAPRKAIKVAGKKATARKSQEASLFDKVVGIIQDSAEGITTSELNVKTGLTDRQIWGITSRAAKLGKIKKTKRGIYLPE